ncbi:MAG: glycosyltransferase family 39 protein [Thermomicrobiaceae bacterium]|nr:glycosyltransferase family 39 protein [Thermomicrobiaceae bacterium]
MGDDTTVSDRATTVEAAPAAEERPLHRPTPIPLGLSRRAAASAALVGGIVLLGVALRAWLMARSGWMIDGDEATFGIMGQRILRGAEHPIFLYGQPYMGSLQAYFAAALFAVAGSSRLALKAVTFPEFAAFALSLFFLARRIYGTRAATLATLLAAVPPIYVVSSTARLWGPLLDAMTLGNLVLLLAVDEVYRETPPRRPLLRAFAMGALVGFGFWLHGQIIVYAVTAAALLLLGDKRVVLSARVPAAVAGFLVGDLPVLDFARNHDYTTFHHLLGVGADHSHNDYVGVARHYVRVVVPRVTGMASPWAPYPWWLKLALVAVIGGAVLALVVRRWRGIAGWLRLSLRPGRPEDALLLFGGVMSLAFVFSSFGQLSLIFKDFDATGRYAIPLASVMPIILAGEIERLWRHARPVAALAVAVLLVGSLYGYVRADPYVVWQSPYWSHLPPSNAPLIAALDEMGVDTVWMNHWAGKPLMFETRERIATADYYDLTVGHGIDRLSADSNRVRAAALPAFVFVTDQARVPMEDWLAARQIPYEKRVVPGYVILRPSRHVDPADVVQFMSYAW